MVEQQQTVDGAKIRLLRVQKDWSAEDLAKRSELSTAYIYKIEKGESTPSISVLTKIADALDVEASELLVNTQAIEVDNSLKILRNYLVHSVAPAKTEKVFNVAMASFMKGFTKDKEDIDENQTLNLIIQNMMTEDDKFMYDVFKQMADKEINVSISKSMTALIDDADFRDAIIMVLAMFMVKSRTND